MQQPPHTGRPVNSCLTVDYDHSTTTPEKNEYVIIIINNNNNRISIVPYGRNIGRRMVVARSNCSRMGVERRSNRSQIVVVTTA